jgi:hypothetical protein
MLIGPGTSTGIIQSCEVVGLSGSGFLSPTTTAPSLDCTLKCSVTVALPSHQGTASFRVSPASGDGHQQIGEILGHRKFSANATFLTSPSQTNEDKEEDEEDGATFDSLDLHNNDDDDDQDHVPIGEILEKLQVSILHNFLLRH